jgi:hypothetical protein
LFQGTFEEDIEIDRLDPAEEFLKCCEVGDLQKTDFLSDSIHFFKVPDGSTIILFPVSF